MACTNAIHRANVKDNFRPYACNASMPICKHCTTILFLWINTEDTYNLMTMHAYLSRFVDMHVYYYVMNACEP